MTIHAVIDSPLGPLTLAASAAGLRAVIFGDEEPAENPAQQGSPGSPIIQAATTQLDEYFAGTRTVFDLPLEAEGTAFQLQAWEVLRGIPFGETISYGEQARRLGDARKCRAVGGANGRNQLSIIVPCHRVVGANGKLTGYASGVEHKQWLLEHERRITSR